MRTKNFDPDEALKDALMTFWQQGFEATNLPELLEAMGVGRASFYNAFGSKRDIFLRSLDLYFETVRAHLESLLADVGDSRQAVARLRDRQSAAEGPYYVDAGPLGAGRHVGCHSQL